MVPVTHSCPAQVRNPRAWLVHLFLRLFAQPVFGLAAPPLPRTRVALAVVHDWGKIGLSTVEHSGSQSGSSPFGSRSGG
jgi:hypothetical protein